MGKQESPVHSLLLCSPQVRVALWRFRAYNNDYLMFWSFMISHHIWSAVHSCQRLDFRVWSSASSQVAHLLPRSRRWSSGDEAVARIQRTRSVLSAGRWEVPPPCDRSAARSVGFTSGFYGRSDQVLCQETCSGNDWICD